MTLPRDYTCEADEQLALMDPRFCPEDSALWKDHIPKPTETMESKVLQADEELDSLTVSARKSQFEADCLALARDCAQLGQLVKEVSRSEQAARTEKILHLKHQNSIGAGIVADYMDKVVSIKQGNMKDQASLIDRVRGYKVS